MSMQLKSDIEMYISKFILEAGVSDVKVEVTQSENSDHGDYTTNIALVSAKKLKKNPIEIAESIKKAMVKTPFFASISRIEIVAPGFINIFLTDEFLLKVLKEKSEFQKKKFRIMVEYAHPNTHKAFHIGHLRNIITGECMVRLFEEIGNEVIRANYQGDVGLHIAKCLYGLGLLLAKKNKNEKNNLNDDIQNAYEEITKIEKEEIHKKIELLGKAYVEGNKAYEENNVAKAAIGEINKIIYTKDKGIYGVYFDLYNITRQWSLSYFENIYKRVGSHFDRYYFESETYEPGIHFVLDGLKRGIFEKSDGAIIFPGERCGLHNRVFITSEGNPTYEGKDMGLASLQFGEYHPDKIIHCVATEQIEYFKVIFAAIERLFPEYKGKEQHIPYGWIRLKNSKMSSRTGNVVLGEWLLDEAKKEIYTILETNNSSYEKELQEEIAEKAAVAAVKYAFLKVSPRDDIAFDFKESVSFTGDSGPYLLYTYARCQSVLRKSEKEQLSKTHDEATAFMKEERELMRLLMFFPEIIKESGETFIPSTLCTYLFSLSQCFNLFYARCPIVGNTRRLTLTTKTAQILHKGLYLLGIDTVERM